VLQAFSDFSQESERCVILLNSVLEKERQLSFNAQLQDTRETNEPPKTMKKEMMLMMLMLMTMVLVE
jgi:hypothetical protein